MDSKNELTKQVMMAVRELNINSVLFRNAVGRKLGLNVADNECLSFLTIVGQATPTELSRYTGLSTGSTTAMLDRLEKARLIIRKPHTKDRRSVLIEVHEHWKVAAWPLMADLLEANAAAIANYSPEELQAITGLLTRFAANVKHQTENIEKGLS